MLDLGLVLSNAAVANGSSSCEELLAMAEKLDGLPRWGHVWVGDSLVSVPRLESTVFLAACAARTNRIRLGVACQASLGLRNPVAFAIQWASLDVLSDGRMTLIACTGTGITDAGRRELRVFGVSHKERIAMMEEAIAILRLASTGEPIFFEGRYITLDGVCLGPRPVQRYPPIWLAANPPDGADEGSVLRSLTRVAELGDGWMTFAVPPRVLAQRIELLRELRTACGRSAGNFPVCVYLDVNVNTDVDDAFNDAVTTCQKEGRRNASRESLASTAAIGHPDACVETVRKLIEAGVTSVALRPITQRPSDQLERLVEQVAPHL